MQNQNLLFLTLFTALVAAGVLVFNRFGRWSEIRPILICASLVSVFYGLLDLGMSEINLIRFYTRHESELLNKLQPAYLLLQWINAVGILAFFTLFRKRITNSRLRGIHYVASVMLVMVLVTLLLWNPDRTYTALYLLLLIFLMLLQLINRRRYMGYYYLALLAFGILFFVQQTVVWQSHFMSFEPLGVSGLKTGPVPLDCYLVLACQALLVVMLYEWVLKIFYLKNMPAHAHEEKGAPKT